MQHTKQQQSNVVLSQQLSIMQLQEQLKQHQMQSHWQQNVMQQAQQAQEVQQMLRRSLQQASADASQGQNSGAGALQQLHLQTSLPGSQQATAAEYALKHADQNSAMRKQSLKHEHPSGGSAAEQLGAGQTAHQEPSPLHASQQHASKAAKHPMSRQQSPQLLDTRKREQSNELGDVGTSANRQQQQNGTGAQQVLDGSQSQQDVRRQDSQDALYTDRHQHFGAQQLQQGLYRSGMHQPLAREGSQQQLSSLLPQQQTGASQMLHLDWTNPQQQMIRSGSQQQLGRQSLSDVDSSKSQQKMGRQEPQQLARSAAQQHSNPQQAQHTGVIESPRLSDFKASGQDSDSMLSQRGMLPPQPGSGQPTVLQSRQLRQMQHQLMQRQASQQMQRKILSQDEPQV